MGTKRVLDESFGIRCKTYHHMSIFRNIKFAFSNTSIYNSKFLIVPGVWGVFLVMKVGTFQIPAWTKWRPKIFGENSSFPLIKSSFCTSSCNNLGIVIHPVSLTQNHRTKSSSPLKRTAKGHLLIFRDFIFQEKHPKHSNYHKQATNLANALHWGSSGWQISPFQEYLIRKTDGGLSIFVLSRMRLAESKCTMDMWVFPKMLVPNNHGFSY